MKVGDAMMARYARTLEVVAAVTCALLVAAPTLGAQAAPVLRGMEAAAGSAGPVIRLEVSGELEIVHYSPQAGVWVVEMADATWEDSLGLLMAPELGVERAELSRLEEFGKQVTRLTVWLAEPGPLELVSRDGGIDLLFGDRHPSAAPEVMGEPLEVVSSSSETPRAEPAFLITGSSLLEVIPVVADGGLVVELHGDGALDARAFALSDPDRVVVDLVGVVNRVERSLFSLNSPLVRRVRVAQFKAVPTPISRVVVDLERSAQFSVEATGSGATLTVGMAGSSVAARSVSVEALASVEQPVRAVESTLETPPTPARTDAAQADPVEEPAPEWATPAGVEPVVASAPIEPPPLVTEDVASPWVAHPSQLLEEAAAAEALAVPTDVGGATFAPTEIQTDERQFTGEPITMTMKDADIRDVLKTFATLTQLNIVVDPEVSGSVTVELHDVPWDQTLDLILKINGLGYVLENNILRVAPMGKLAAEKAAIVAYLQEEERAKPQRTILKPVSYAVATEMAEILAQERGLLSDRGSVNVDARTNTLIIRDTIDRVQGVLALVEQLDRPTKQVMIEARIVETTRDFSHQLGVSWGFSGVMDQEHGNDTGLRFPSEVTAGGGVNTGAVSDAVGALAMTFSNILNTFNLDFQLSAAESDGYVKIISSPRITTQNLEEANIRSGLQIPVQTVANNTVTVQYVDATLNLTVTPQITAEGTVILDINIRKQEAALGAAVAGGTNVPIFTRDAQTKLLVRDGGTTVIAGIYQINDQSTTDRVPFLHRIPFLGAMFRNKDVFQRHDELLIFITPRIVKY